MIQALATERHRDVIARAEVSCRCMLRGLAATAAAATGLARPGQVFANPDAAITPFQYRAPARALDDLKRRLAQTRWPDRGTVADWSQGVPITKMKALVEYWRTGYDWRRCEARLNRLPQYRTEIDGLGIHFLHVRSRETNALPILITHGWPSSVIEFFKVIDPLTNPTAHGGRAEDAFHVVAPSLPGFAFSDKPAERGWNNARIARAWAKLVRRLGYSRYVAQGGDWGAFITTTMAQQRPAGLAGIHLNFPLMLPDPIPTQGLSADEQAAVAAVRALLDGGPGVHIRVQTTRPQTVGYALADSPVGQAAWIYNIFGSYPESVRRVSLRENMGL
jgi:pimeloyl-ACP methyl ester carboxylesterase